MYMIWHKKLGILKQYPYKIQAIIWCFMHRYVTTGRGQYFLNESIEIIGEGLYERVKNLCRN